MRTFQNVRSLRVFLTALLVAALTACGSHAVVPEKRSAVAGQRQTVSIGISIPLRRKGASQGRGPRYVSPSTTSVVVSVNGGAAQSAKNLGPDMPGCTQRASDTLDCTIPVDAPYGSDSFDVATFDAANGGGNELSQGTANADVDAAPKQIPVTLDGIVRSIQLAITGPSGPVVCGGQVTAPMSIVAFDADGNRITPPGHYHNPISLSDSDSQGSTSLATTTISDPAISSVDVVYNGGPTGPLTPQITAHADGATDASVTFSAINNPMPLAETYTYVDDSGYQITETIKPVNALPYLYDFVLNGIPNEGGYPNVPVDVSGIPTQGLCDIQTQDSGYIMDSYVGIAHESSTRDLLKVYLETQYAPRPPCCARAGTNYTGLETNIFYPTPLTVDRLPETAGDSWTSDPSMVMLNGPVPYGNSADVEDWGFSSLTPGEECDVSYEETFDRQFYWGQGSCYGAVNSLSYQNYGTEEIPSVCNLGPGMPSTATHIREDMWQNSLEGAADYYNVDGIGTVCIINNEPNLTQQFWLTAVEAEANDVYSLQTVDGVSAQDRYRHVKSLRKSGLTMRTAMLAYGLRSLLRHPQQVRSQPGLQRADSNRVHLH